MDLDQIVQDSTLRDHVIDQLTSLGGVVKGEEILLVCPFHADRSPSLNVHIGHKIHPGSYYCFSCQASGGWRKLAKALHLSTPETNSPVVSLEKPTSKQEMMANFAAYTQIRNRALVAEYCNTPKETIPELRGLEELPEDFEWRGLGRDFYESLGASYYWKDSIEYLHFPLRKNGRYTGYTLCNLYPEPKQTKYLVHCKAKENLLFYDLLPKREPLVLTEGHFDAMKLIHLGFNATAIFGVSNWSDLKKDMVLYKNPPIVLIAMDGDEPGWEASQKIYLSLHSHCPVDIFYLPLKDQKLDPGNMPTKYVNLLRAQIDDRLSSRHPVPILQDP